MRVRNFSLIKGRSTSRAITAVCTLAATTLDAHFVLPWFAQAPSISKYSRLPLKTTWATPLGERHHVSTGRHRKVLRRKLNLLESGSSATLRHGWGPWRKRTCDVPICVGKKKGAPSCLWSSVFSFADFTFSFAEMFSLQWFSCFSNDIDI